MKLFLITFFLLFQSINAQEKLFYAHLLNSYHLKNDSLIFQPIKFQSTDIVYNKIAQLNDEFIKVTEPGTYEINGFVNINPGVIGKSKKDKIDISVYLVKNYTKATQQVLAVNSFSYILGNLDVSNSFTFFVPLCVLSPSDELQVLIKLSSSSTLSINESKKYHHVNKPTGMNQIAGLRIKKID